MLAIDGFELDVPDTSATGRSFGYGHNRPAFGKARVVALAQCGPHVFPAAEVDAYSVGEKPWRNRCLPGWASTSSTDRGSY